MKFRNVGGAGGFACALAWLVAIPAYAQTPPAQATGAPPIKVETRVVLVDAVVTDKKGNYIRDLTAKDFKVWEDNKQQEVTSFSFEANPTSPAGTLKRYLILFFDNSTMDVAQQAQARQAAAKFIDSNAGPNRPMAIVDYVNGLRIAQNFTEDAARLKQVVTNVKLAGAPLPATPGFPSLNHAETDYRVRDGILALRSLVRNLESVPGRKSLVLLTGGFPLTPDRISELTALIDACNKANVAVYPIDARGLVAVVPGVPQADLIEPRPQFERSLFKPVSFTPAAFFFQRPGGGTPSPGGGGRGGGGAPASPGGGAPSNPGGSRGPTGGTPVVGGRGTSPTTGTYGGGNTGVRGGGGTTGINPNYRNPLGVNPLNPRNILPPFSDSVSGNQQALYMLASGTGGFVIANTNDLLGGLERIGKEQNEYYLLGYTPDETPDGSCHTLKVKVDRGGAQIRARTGYCNVKSQDLLAGNAVEKDLEKLAMASAAGSVAASMQVPFFYTAPNTVRANVVLDIPTDTFRFEKHKGKFQSEVNLLGVATKEDGTVALKFSDTIKFSFENKKDVEAFQERPTTHYQKDVEAAPGKYSLKVVVSAGGSTFGKLETPLVIEPYDGKEFTISGVAFSRFVRKVSEGDIGLDAALIEDRTPLLWHGFEFTPSGSNHFKKTDSVMLYAEVYEPLLVGPPADPSKPVMAAIQLRVLDKAGQQKLDSGLMRAEDVLQAGNPVIPVAMKLPVDQLTPGSYKLEFSSLDSAGRTFKRIADFEVI